MRLTAQYHYAELEDIYRQHFLGLLGQINPWVAVCSRPICACSRVPTAALPAPVPLTTAR